MTVSDWLKSEKNVIEWGITMTTNRPNEIGSLFTVLCCLIDLSSDQVGLATKGQTGDSWKSLAELLDTDNLRFDRVWSFLFPYLLVKVKPKVINWNNTEGSVQNVDPLIWPPFWTPSVSPFRTPIFSRKKMRSWYKYLLEVKCRPMWRDGGVEIRRHHMVLEIVTNVRNCEQQMRFESLCFYCSTRWIKWFRTQKE